MWLWRVSGNAATVRRGRRWKDRGRRGRSSTNKSDNSVQPGFSPCHTQCFVYNPPAMKWIKIIIKLGIAVGLIYYVVTHKVLADVQGQKELAGLFTSPKIL